MLLELDLLQKSQVRWVTYIVGFFIAAYYKEYNDDKWTCGFFIIVTIILLTERCQIYMYAIASTIPRDATAAYRFFWLNRTVSRYEKKNWTVARVFKQYVDRHPKKTAFRMDTYQMSFEDIENFSNKIGSYFKSNNFNRGDSIALIMETRCEYPCIWLGLSKIGIVTALINSNLRKETLLHSIKAANCKAIIFGAELSKAVIDILSDDAISKLKLYQFSDKSQRNSVNFAIVEGSTDLTSELETQKAADLSTDIAEGNPKDKMLYVYTSGTTGMPKAAVITHLRYMLMCVGVHEMLAIRKNDVIYNPLPLYHTAGGILGVGNVFVYGVSMVFRKKFSASNFWSDCKKYDCTVAQYIGELCRYLLMTPPKPDDTEHGVRLMYGNGLRPQIWELFLTRFEVPQIGEVYGSTEGNSNLANIDNRIGAIGFVPLLGEFLYPVTLIRCDEETGEPIRSPKGHCIRCKPGEAGIFIGKVNPKRAVNSFSGYADRTATEKKLIYDVFSKGDVYFNSGDILVRDLLNYYYFKDRIGDTFRWRGENVATSEIEAIITNVIGMEDCVVYGVDVPHVEGKAGMAAIVDPYRKVDMDHLSSGIREILPTYAQPVFIRLLDKMPKTATFKLKKRELMLEGFDINQIQDDIYFMNSDGVYRKLTQQQFEEIESGKARL